MDDCQITETMDMLHSQRINLTRAKDVSPPNTNCTRPSKSPLAATELSCLLHDAICSEHIPFCHCWGWWECTAYFFSLTTLTFDLWPWHSKSSERGNKHVFPVNLVQIRSAVPRDIWFTNKQTNTKVTDSTKNRTLCSLLRAVTNLVF